MYVTIHLKHYCCISVCRGTPKTQLLHNCMSRYTKSTAYSCVRTHLKHYYCIPVCRGSPKPILLHSCVLRYSKSTADLYVTTHLKQHDYCTLVCRGTPKAHWLLCVGYKMCRDTPVKKHRKV